MKTGKYIRRWVLCLPMVLILLFGEHMGWVRCACSGDVSLLVFNSEQCCEGDEDCMNVVVAETDDYVPCQIVSLVVPVAMDALASYPDCSARCFATKASYYAPNANLSPGGEGEFSMVMRV
ncbi:MAG: hypothetical protein SPJ13_08375 [Bacteroidales bacterium]|nr:hypothetical protein [Bacteroidales bacterium]